jgi:hypothetical protein
MGETRPNGATVGLKCYWVGGRIGARMKETNFGLQK